MCIISFIKLYSCLFLFFYHFISLSSSYFHFLEKSWKLIIKIKVLSRFCNIEGKKSYLMKKNTQGNLFDANNLKMLNSASKEHIGFKTISQSRE